MDEKEQQEAQPTPPVEETAEEVVEEVVEAPVEAKQPEQPKQELPKKLVEEPKVVSKAFSERLSKLKMFWMECVRVLRVTRKPDKQEFTTIVKISSIGMAIIGVIGFLIHFAKELLF